MDLDTTKPEQNQTNTKIMIKKIITLTAVAALALPVLAAETNKVATPEPNKASQKYEKRVDAKEKATAKSTAISIADATLEPYGTVSWTGLDGKAVLGAGANVAFSLNKNLALVGFGESDNTQHSTIDRAGIGLRYTAYAGTRLSLDGGVAGAYDCEGNSAFLRLPLGATVHLAKTEYFDLGIRAGYAFDISGNGKHGSADGRAFIGPVLTYKF